MLVLGLMYKKQTVLKKPPVIPFYHIDRKTQAQEEEKMKNMQAQPKESRTPTLDSYRTIYRRLPDQPEVRRIISRRRRTICINLAAQPGAKIDQLMP